jgi:hypothetical protein
MANRPTNRPEASPPRGLPDIEVGKWTKAVARFTGLLALFTFLLVVTSTVTDGFIYLQWQASLDAQRDARQQLRAVIAQGGVSVLPTNVKDGKPTTYLFFFNFQNLGGTRTNTFNAWVSMRYFSGNVPNSQDFSRPYDKIETNNTIIPPNSTAQLSPVALSSEDVEGAKSHLGVAVAWGHAEWSDIFEPKVIHNITFCLFAIPQDSGNGAVVFKPAPVKQDCNHSD